MAKAKTSATEKLANSIRERFNELISDSNEEIKEQIRNKINQTQKNMNLHIMARDIINKYNKYMQHLKKLSAATWAAVNAKKGSEEKSMHQKKVQELKDIMEEYVTEDLQKDFFKSIFNFEENLRTFLNIQIKIIFVDDSEFNNEKRIFKTRAFVGQDILEHLGKLQSDLSFSFTASLKENLDMLSYEERLDKLYNKAKERLSDTTNEVYRRFDKARERAKNSNNATKYLLWKNDINGWQKVQITNHGRILEAYASFILAKTKLKRCFGESADNKNIDQLIDIFVKEGILKVDNMSGITHGDVEIEDDDNETAMRIEGQIKMFNAGIRGFSYLFTIIELFSDKNYADTPEQREYLAYSIDQILTEIATPLSSQSDVTKTVNKVTQKIDEALSFEEVLNEIYI